MWSAPGRTGTRARASSSWPLVPQLKFLRGEPAPVDPVGKGSVPKVALRAGESLGAHVDHLHRSQRSHGALRSVAAASSGWVPRPLWMDEPSIEHRACSSWHVSNWDGGARRVRPAAASLAQAASLTWRTTQPARSPVVWRITSSSAPSGPRWNIRAVRTNRPGAGLLDQEVDDLAEREPREDLTPAARQLPPTSSSPVSRAAVDCLRVSS